MRPMKPNYDAFAALIFDCDGTLVDSMPLHYQAWVQTLTPHGVPFPESQFYALAGVPTQRITELLAEEHHKRWDSRALSHEKEAAFRALAGAVQPIAPVVAVAERYRGRKPMAVATGSLRALARHELEAIGILAWFDAFVAAEDVTRPKPAPDAYLEAARRLGVEPAQCVAFEDSVLGLEAIRAAGMTAVDIRPWRESLDR